MDRHLKLLNKKSCFEDLLKVYQKREISLEETVTQRFMI